MEKRRVEGWKRWLANVPSSRLLPLFGCEYLERSLGLRPDKRDRDRRAMEMSFEGANEEGKRKEWERTVSVRSSSINETVLQKEIEREVEDSPVVC